MNVEGNREISQFGIIYQNGIAKLSGCSVADFAILCNVRYMSLISF